MKIPFDINHKDKIEEGTYKVVTRDGRSVKILCWDANNETPIIAMIEGYAWQTDKDGKSCRFSDNSSDFFIETPDPDLSELLHQAVCRAINEPNIPYEERKLYSDKLIPYIEELEACRKIVKNLQPLDLSNNGIVIEPF